MKKIIAPLALLLVVSIVLAGCSSSPTTSAPTTTAPTTTSAPTTSAPATTTAPTTTAKPTTTTTTAPTSTTAPPTTSSKYGGTLRWTQPISPGSPIGWPAEASGETLRTMQLSIQTLMVGQLDGTLSPGLVTSYETVTDPANASVTLHLRKGVKFSDGSDFTAAVVKWNLETTKAGPANVGTTVYWKSFDVLDDYTIRINFTTWQNRILTGFGMVATNMVSKAAFDKNGVDWMRINMVGTGPFVQTQYQRDVITKTARNNNYWDTGKPYLDNYQYLYVADEMTRVALFRSGGTDVLDLNGNGRIANELKAAGYNIASQLGGINVLIPDSINASSPWSNLKVRQAAEYAIDKVALNNAFGYGYNQPAYQVSSPSTNVYDPNFANQRTYDVAKAKQLLVDAGYPTGFKTRIIAADTANRDLILAIKSYLDKVGIQTDTEFAPSAKMSEYQIAPGTWNNGLIYGYLFEWPNFNYGLNLWFSIPGAWYQSMKKPDGWKEALVASLATPTPDKAVIQKLIRTLYDDATVIGISYPAVLSALAKNVNDTGIYSRIQNYFTNPENAWLSK